ncbi:hypothetical protein GLOIN_2v1778530 [Rhizophagus irregularis DAOM 181602=DAOM 197198]|nr:hypothetical protein GLOIN_2v1778530 [Rhizophagus irregularis DAOM 181602=DAOM 197198]
MSTYPASNIIVLNQNGIQYTYTIIKEGYYPQNDILCYTSARSCNNTQFKIPDNYLIQTSWGRGSSKHIIQCGIIYIEKIPVFKISFGENFQASVESIHSATKAANFYLQIKKPNTQARLSGVHVFCLNIEQLYENKRVYVFNEQLAVNFTNTAAKYFHSDDCPTLQKICFTVQDKNFQANQRPIARDSYRNLAALQPELPCETTIYKTKKRINEEMNNTIPISILNISNQLSPTPINENPDINDPEIIEEVLKYIGKAGYRRITDILLFILPDLINRRVINSDNPIINLRIFGDGRNVGQPISNKLNDLVLNGLRDSNGTIWTINPYFSSDWKFMAIVLGFNASNSKHFCP